MRTLLIIFVVVAVIVFVLGLGYMLLLFQRTRKLRQDKDPQLIRAERIEKRAQDRYKDEVRAQLFTSALNDPNRWGKRTISDMSKMVRSEEHTSELQSPDHLVCRLLLEKKKKKNIETTRY